MSTDIRILLDEAVTLLREMVAIPSPSFMEEEVCSHISSRLSSFGIEHIRVKNNLLSVNRNYSPLRKTLMLCAHIDTVVPAADYSFDPYRPEYSEFESGMPAVLGLGSNDDGASAVALISAFRHFYDSPLPANLMLVLSAEEERSGKNGMDAVWSALERGLPYNGTMVRIPDWAIIGEPTCMRAAIAERGLLVIDGTAHGASGHAANGDGVNALYEALDDIARLRAFRFPKVSPQMGEVRINVTQIQAGYAHNVIPQTCEFVVDVRTTDMYTNSEIMEILQSLCRSELRARNLHNRASCTPENSVLPECAAATGISTFISPTTSDWMRIGCDAVKMGPGDSSRSHKKDEYVTVGEIEEGIRKYIRFIYNLEKTENNGNTLE